MLIGQNVLIDNIIGCSRVARGRARSMNLTRFTFLDPGSLFLRNKSNWIHEGPSKSVQVLSCGYLIWGYSQPCEPTMGVLKAMKVSTKIQCYRTTVTYWQNSIEVAWPLDMYFIASHIWYPIIWLHSHAVRPAKHAVLTGQGQEKKETIQFCLHHLV